MKKSIMVPATALAAASALLLSACGEAPEESSGAGGEGSDFKACMVSDSGGWDDKSFNQSGREGLNQAKEEFKIDEALAESSDDSDFAPNVDNMVQQGCDLTFGVGYLLEDALQEAAEANTDMNFALIDSTFADPDGNAVTLDNAKPLVFNTAEASYLAGYLAAGMSESGKVATFGGMQIPSVSIFMDGFADGVDKYNEDKDADVELLGWDKEKQEGSFSGNFEDQGQGQALTEQFISQGADIIMPVAGPVGLGAASAAAEADGTSVIWVDSDGYESAAEYKDIMLTSVMKEISTAVFDTVGAAKDGNWDSAAYVGTLENGGVGLAPYHDFEDKVDDGLKAEVEDLKQQIIDGEITVESPSAPQQ